MVLGLLHRHEIVNSQIKTATIRAGNRGGRLATVSSDSFHNTENTSHL